MIKRILLSSPKIHESFFSKAKSKNIWYKKQTKLIETQKIKAMKQRYNSSYEHIKKSASLHDFINVRTSAEDIRVGSQQKEQATLVKKFDSFSLLKNNTIRGNSLENNKSKILDYGKQESQSEKISKVIEHNKAFESRLLTSSKNSFHFDIISSYFNTKKLKNFCFPNKISSFHSNFNMCETDMIKKENKLNIKLNSEQCMGNLLERVMSSTFYGHKNKKNIKKCATSRNFYQKNSYNLNENGENMKNEESFTNNEQKNRINIYRIHGESQTKKIDNLNKEKFQMLIRNSHQTNSMVRKTRHRQFFIVQNNLKRAMSVPLKR